MFGRLTVFVTTLLMLAAAAPAQVMMNEFLYDTQGTDDPAIMFVEIWGPGGTSLAGWSLVGINGNGGQVYLTVPLTGTIPADGYYVVGGANVANVDQIVTADFQNAGGTSGPQCDGIDLRNSSGQTVDHLCYGECASNEVCVGEGGSNAPDPFPSGGINRALARIPDHQDTDNNAADWVVTETLTPGVTNAGVPCEPQNVWLADIRENDENGVPVLNGEFVIVRGIVNVDNYTLDSLTLSNFFIQDDEAGVNVFRGSVPPNISVGDCVIVSGWVAQYNGLTEIISSGSGSCLFEVQITGQTEPPVPVAVSTTSPLETFEGMLVRINNVSIVGGTWPGGDENANITISDGSGTITLRIDKDTNIDGTPQPTSPFDVIGIITQFDNTPPYTSGYQITPRSTADILTSTSAGDPRDAVAAGSFRLLGAYPNPFNSSAQIRFAAGSARELELRIYDIAGREVESRRMSGLTPGEHTITWNPGGATGIYFARLYDGATVQSVKLLYMK